MVEETVPEGLDEPARGEDDHAALLSELDSHDLSRALTAAAVDPSGRFDVDETADADGTFPQSVASGGPTPAGVILWTRIAPDAFVEGEPLGVRVAEDPAFDTVVYEGVVDLEDVTEEHR